ncbi:hypothetical protein D8S78_01760 [Natrialba swarupiae]|nr:hypothetical protein [Natrialba swarupiae]
MATIEPAVTTSRSTGVSLPTSFLTGMWSGPAVSDDVSPSFGEGVLERIDPVWPVNVVCLLVEVTVDERSLSGSAAYRVG